MGKAVVGYCESLATPDLGSAGVAILWEAAGFIEA